MAFSKPMLPDKGLNSALENALMQQWEMDYKSDDYGVIYVDTVEYDTFLERNKNGNK